MTDRHAAYIVVLAEDVREDDAEDTINALKQIKGVLSVEPVVSDYALHVATQRVQLDAGKRIIDIGISVMTGKPTPSSETSS